MKKFLRHCIFGVTLLGGAASGLRGSNTTVSTAGVAGLILSPLVVQGLTGSTLEVNIEVYRDTLAITHYAPDGTPCCYKFGEKPFRLSAPLAMQQHLTQLSTTASSPTATGMVGAVDKIGALLEKQQAALQDFRRTREKFAAEFRSQTETGGEAQQLLKDMDDVLRKNDDLAVVFGGFRAAVASGLADGSFTSEEVTKTADRLLAVKLTAAGVPRDFSPNMGAFLRSQLQGAFVKTLRRAPVDKEVKPASGAAESGLLVFPEILPVEGEMAATADLLWEMAERTRTLQDNSWHLLKADGKVHTVHETELGPNVNKVLAVFGFKTDFAALLKLTKRGDFNLSWSEELNGIQRVAGIPIEIASLSFTGVSISANFGPIANEVVQGLFTENDFIDRIVTDKTRWTRFNYAYSSGGAGDHNAIVYMDNMLTPIMKSARFDPSQFIAANAQIYERAAEVLSDVVGVPLAKDAAATDGGLESLNLLGLKSRKQKAFKAAGDERDRLLAVLKLVLDEHAVLQEKFIEPAKPAKAKVPAQPAADGKPEVPEQPAQAEVPATWKADKDAKTHLLELATSLGATAVRLEQH